MDDKSDCRMTRAEIIGQVRQYFGIAELVCRHCYEMYGDKAWQFLDTDALHTLLMLRRDILQVPLTCNTMQAMQRGLRCNICQMPKGKTMSDKMYLSAHTMGKAFDLSSRYDGETMRRMIDEKQNLLPCNVRVEDGVGWLHIDTFDMGTKVYHFKV